MAKDDERIQLPFKVPSKASTKLSAKVPVVRWTDDSAVHASGTKADGCRPALPVAEHVGNLGGKA